MKRIYLDNASLTEVDPRVLRVTKKLSSPAYMNPSSIHSEGVLAKAALGEARRTAAQSIGAHNDEVIFTASGTEANNLAILGVLAKSKREKPHIVVSAIEHSSIIQTVNFLRETGKIDLDMVGVDESGVIRVDDFRGLLRPETVLVSVMMVNNETGAMQPIQEVVKAVRLFKKESGASPYVHSDMCQAMLYQDINFSKLGVDIATFDAHKIHGPRGVGMLYVRRGTEIAPIIYGGEQESGLRAGTENLPGIGAFAEALRLASDFREKEAKRVADLHGVFVEGLMRIDSNITIHSTASASPHIVSAAFPSVADSEFFVLQLDAHGIACSTKSSCLRDEDESYVLKAMGKNSHQTVRFSFGRFTKKSEIKKALKVIGKILQK